MVVRALVGAMALGVVACSPFGGGAFSCERDDQCGPGKCSASYCSFADSGCASGYRFGDASGPVANSCVGVTGTGSDASVIDLDARTDLDAPAPGVVCYGQGFGKICFDAANVPATPATLTAQTIDTDTSPLCSTVVQTTPGWCVVVATELTISGTVTAIGTKPLVLLATGTLQVDGTLDVASHRGGQTGAGAVATDATLCDPGTPPGNNGGGAGGSFGAVGGNGGNNGGTAGALQPANSMRGGCAGQDGKSGTNGTRGAGGGVAYLIAGTKIAVTGAIDASGAAGTAGVNGNAGAGGGGAGGLIGLDAPIVTNGGAIFANGGGGAEGSGNTTKGNDGNESTLGVAAAATASASNGGDGGAGGAVTGAGNGGNANTFGGGGGGGGAGAIRLFGAAAITGGVVSPPAS
ncbi:MAG: hypothetical protein ABI467_09175 [Kofleriaceae bacterium]